jgi:hypothetical protein
MAKLARMFDQKSAVGAMCAVFGVGAMSTTCGDGAVSDGGEGAGRVGAVAVHALSSIGSNRGK